MTIYNQNFFNEFLYNSDENTPVVSVEAVGKSPDVNKYISPYHKRFFPEFWESDYPLFLQLFRYYLEYLENNGNAYWNVANTVELASISTTVEENLNNLREQFAPDFRFEDFPNIDKRKFLENAKRYFSIKGTDQSFRFLFRMLGHEIDIFNPLDDTLFISEHSTIGDQKLIDSYYYNPYTYDVRTDLPYSEWNQFIRKLNHPIGTMMFGTFLVLLANGVIQIPTINTTIPNLSYSPVKLIDTVPATANPTIEVSGDISLFPDPADINSLDRLVIRIGSEDMVYTAINTSTNTFTISDRAVNDTVQNDHNDISTFIADINNNYIIMSDRLNMHTGKVIAFTTTEELPTPLTANTNYYITLMEIYSKIQGNISAVSTELVVDDASNFPDSGTVYIKGELVTYSNKSGNTLEGLSRGQNSTVATSHLDDTKIYVWDRIVRLSETYEDVLYSNYINLTDTGVGTHTVVGSGQEITLFTGFDITRPQALTVRELNAYTSYNDITKDIFTEVAVLVTFDEEISAVDLITNLFSTNAHPFSEGELIKFISPSTGLTSAIDDTITTIPVEDTSLFNSSGTIKIENEWISYSGKTINSLTGATRGALGSTATAHSINSIVTCRGFETTGNVELDGLYRVRRSSNITFFLIDDNDDIIDIISDSSGTFRVFLHDFNGADRWDTGNEVTQTSTSSVGEIVWPVNVSPHGRILYIDSSVNNWDNLADIEVEGPIDTAVVIDPLFYTSYGDYSLTECDFNGLTFNDLENGGNEYPYILKTRLPLIREELPIDITKRYFIPNLTIDVETDDVNWVPTLDTFGSFDVTERGHISMANSNFKGLLRGFVAPNRPVIEVDPTTNLEAQRGSLGSVRATIGTATIRGNFTTPPATIDTDMTVELNGNYYNVISSTVNTINLSPVVTIDDLNTNDIFVSEAFLSNSIWSGDGSGSTSIRRHWQDENFGYGLGIGNFKNYIKINLSSNIASSNNWIVSSDIAFNENSKGHIKQFISGAEGIIRAKNTVSTLLNGSIADNSTTITVSSTSQFPDSGRVLINNEFITYTSKTSTTFSGIVRGTHNTTPSLHLDGSTVESANLPESEPNSVIVEVMSGTFSSQVTNTITVGDDFSSENDIRTVNSIESRIKGIPTQGQLVYNEPIDSNDPNKFIVWKILETFQTNNETVIVLDKPYTEPIDPGDGNGTINLINTIKEF